MATTGFPTMADRDRYLNRRAGVLAALEAMDEGSRDVATAFMELCAFGPLEPRRP